MTHVGRPTRIVPNPSAPQELTVPTPTVSDRMSRFLAAMADARLATRLALRASR